jgi:hypothetical protein
MLEVTPVAVLILSFGLFFLFFVALVLGFLLGYSTNRLYNSASKTALNNMGELVNFVREPTTPVPFAEDVPENLESEVMTDAVEALVERGRHPFGPLTLAAQSQLLAREEEG